MKNDIRNLTPEGILKYLTHSRTVNLDYSTIVITGKIGPTGKTWLKQELNARGYNVVEITPSIYLFMVFNDDDNHVVFDDVQNLILVVLNRRLPMEFL